MGLSSKTERVLRAEIKGFNKFKNILVSTLRSSFVLTYRTITITATDGNERDLPVSVPEFDFDAKGLLDRPGGEMSDKYTSMAWEIRKRITEAKAPLLLHG